MLAPMSPGGALTIPAAVKERRARKGWTQEQLAARAGLTASTIGRVEAGHHVPSLATLEAIAGAFGVSLSALLDGKDE